MPDNIPQPPTTSGGLSQSKLGFYGRFGSGGNVDVSYIQSVIDFEALNNITLIEDIKGSDKWQVRDLFQRNVDRNRVEDEIVPFLKDPETIKFFAPLALVLLPMTDGEVNKDLVEISDENVKDEGTDYLKHSIGDAAFFEYKDAPAYSKVKWNPDKVKLVAVDGQHRISALKMLLDDEQRDPLVSNMNIPILIIGFSKSKNLIQGEHLPTLLDVVRQTFVYINNKSQKINESRAILLDNEDINCVAVQEVIQRAHNNDNNKDDEPTNDSSNIPLVMFDWRGEEKNGKPISGPASLFSVRDVKDWFTEYLLGDIKGKGSAKAIREKIIPRLDLESVHARLNSEDLKGLNHKNSDIGRKQVKSILIPSVIFMLENLKPFKKYINKIRELQASTNSEMGTREGRLAYKWICFGKTKVKQSLNESEVEVVWGHMARDLGMLKSELPTLLSRDIGIRAIWSSYSMLYDLLSKDRNESQNWMEFSKWYVELANKLIEEGWFQGIDVTRPMLKAKREKLTHIVYTRSGEIVNYKLEASPKGFGAFIMMLILQLHGDQNLKETAWDNLQDGLLSTVSSGFRRDVKEKMELEGFGGTKSQVRDEEKRRLKIETSKWDNAIRKFFEV